MTEFFREDYELAEEITNLTGVRIAPSAAREIAGKWAAIKIQRRAKSLSDAEYYDTALPMSDLARRVSEGNV